MPFPQQLNERKQQQAEKAYVQDILNNDSMNTNQKHNFQRDSAENVFHLGDTVYLGSEAYQVESFNESNVCLRDMQYPLLIKELARDIFEQMLREYALNDHLIIIDDLSRKQSDKKSKMITELSAKAASLTRHHK